MNKMILFLFAVVLTLSCGSRTGNKSQTVDKHSEAYIRQRIDTIYKTVGKTTYDSEGNEVDYIHNPFNRDSAYCSQRYYALMQEASRLCDETGDILYDYDYWVCGQDFSDDWSCSVDRVYEITDSSALVNLIIHNFDDTETTIALRFERDDWYIDDFSPSEDGNDDKKYLRETIRQCLKAGIANPLERLPYFPAIDRYLADFIGSQYAKGEHCVPVYSIVGVDERNAEDVLVWGSFWVFNYNLVGDTLKCVSGGGHPGLMHVRQTEKGFEVTAFDQVEDGSRFLPTAKKIFGDKFDAFQAINSDDQKRERLRAEALADYVKKHSLRATLYQDYGWPAKRLGEIE
jgi:hypothetical protein